MVNKKLLFLVNVDWFFLSHRLQLALAAKRQGWDVTVATTNTGRFLELEGYGFNLIEMPFERSGKNLITELNVLLKIISLYRTHKPDVVHHIALKASLYGALAARITGIPLVINALTGLGFLFTTDKFSLSKALTLMLMRLGFGSKQNRFIFQNPDDQNLMVEKAGVSPDRSIQIKGSGVDLNDFVYTAPVHKPILHIILPARMLKNKGVLEFVDAAKSVKKLFYKRVTWILCGGVDLQNPSSLSETELKELIDPGYLEWIDHQTDMKKVLMESDIVVLPSYREGLPKALIEACAIGRPIVTTDVPGCRLCVNDGKNGFLVPLNDSQLLAEKISILINDQNLRLEMGRASRQYAETEFSIDHVISTTLSIYNASPN